MHFYWNCLWHYEFHSCVCLLRSYQYDSRFTVFHYHFRYNLFFLFWLLKKHFFFCRVKFSRFCKSLYIFSEFLSFYHIAYLEIMMVKNRVSGGLSQNLPSSTRLALTFCISKVNTIHCAKLNRKRKTVTWRPGII